MTTTIEVTTEQRVTMLRHLAGGKSLDVVAAILKMPRDVVLDIASKHGFPDSGKLNWAADVLAEKQTEDNKASIPAGVPERVGVPVIDRGTPAAPMTRPDELRILLNTAKSHPSKRIRAAADRVFDQLDRLRGLMREDQEKNSEKRRLDAEKAAARAEVDRLEAQLKAAKAKLRGGTTKPAAAPGPRKGIAPTGGGLVTTADLEELCTTSKEIRSWAHGNDVECPDVGRLPSRVLDAWKAAHQDGAA